MSNGRKKPPVRGPYRPQHRCDLYIPIKGECAGLTELVCSVERKCPFFKTKEKALADRIESIRRRKSVGFLVTGAEERMQLEAKQDRDAEER